MTAVMQPYFFPYPGYFQLLAAADDFVFYDDVQFIKGGYINRNQLRNGTFTVPLKSTSHTGLISERELAPKGYERFRKKWLKGLRITYGKEPYFDRAARVVEDVVTSEAETIRDLACESIIRVAGYLGLGVNFLRSSDLSYDRSLTGEDRLLALLTALGARNYVNPIGGRALYGHDRFRAAGLTLSFLQSASKDVPAPGEGSYSILHLLFKYPPEQCREVLEEHYRITAATETQHANHP